MGFETVYAAYPRKDAIGRAERAWDVAADLPGCDVLVAAIEHQVSRKAWQAGLMYVPMFETWLKGKRWCDGFQMIASEHHLLCYIAPQVLRETPPDWWRSHAQTWLVAQALGMRPLAGETMRQLRSRIWVLFDRVCARANVG
ncbi:MAG: hypothetical protein ACRCZI_11090 [Cetobacterium sp.]